MKDTRKTTFFVPKYTRQSRKKFEKTKTNNDTKLVYLVDQDQEIDEALAEYISLQEVVVMLGYLVPYSSYKTIFVHPTYLY
jgi:hypothetical protein